jgi:hypothetical protein
MPTFKPFRRLGLFPDVTQRPNAEWNSFNTFGGGQKVTQTSLSNIKAGVPFWWLFYKATMEVEYNATVGSGESAKSFSGNETFEFYSQTPPNERCVASLDYQSGIAIPENRIVYDNDDFIDGSILYSFMNLQAFKIDNVFVNFYGVKEYLSPEGSTTMEWYINSSLHNEGTWEGFEGYGTGDYDQDNLINTQDFNITLPAKDKNGVNLIAPLKGYVVFGDAAYPDDQWTAEGSITSFNVEWWEQE